MNKTEQAQLDKTLRLIPDYDPFSTAGNCWLDYDAAAKPIEFFKRYLVLIEGKGAGEPFVLEPWQKAIVGNLFGWKRPDGTRRYRKAFVFVGRKNGKTPLCAGIINYVAFCDGEPGAQIYSAAGEREQAALVFRHAAGMINRNPALQNKSRIYRTFKSIEFGGGSNVYKALSADADTKHGLNAHLVVVDELHVQPNRDLVDTLSTSTASRTQPLEIDITTAGVYDVNSICFEHYDYACKVRDGLIDDPYFLPVVYETAKEDNWKDETVWAKANPNLGVSVSLDYLRQACKEAQDVPAKENTFRRLHLNQWTEQDTRWLSVERWNDCAITDVNLTGKKCYAGLDLSTRKDLTALVLFFYDGDRKYVLPFFFAPKENASRRQKSDRVPYLQWAKEGSLVLTEGDTVDFDYIRDFINKLKKKYLIEHIVIDDWQASQIMNQLSSDGFSVIPTRMGFRSFSEPTKALEELILNRNLAHFDNPVMNWCVSNVMIEQDAQENIKPSKSKSTERIDGVVALIMAIRAMVELKPSIPSVYEERGLIAI